TPPRCRSEDLDVAAEDIGYNLNIATGDLCSAFVALCNLAFSGRTYEPRIVEYSQQAAETLAKTMIAGFGLSPTAVHDLSALATQLENAYRGRTRGAEARRRFAAAIRALDGKTKVAHEARYHKGPVERLARTAERVAGTLRLQTEWLRWYATRNPEMCEAAVAAGREIADTAGLVQGMRGFDRLAPELQARVRAWGEEGQSIADAFDRATGHDR
ncbi:MAG: HEPN domain-containing protein, partial [Gammaproteobacteria bacterium]|nr:HEPN domain-containing protein [Gammaproteobacteria bacterium]